MINISPTATASSVLLSDTCKLHSNLISDLNGGYDFISVARREGRLLFAARFAKPTPCWPARPAADNRTWAAAGWDDRPMQTLWLGSAAWSAADPTRAGFATETVQLGPLMAEQSTEVHTIGVPAGYLDTSQTAMNSW